MNDTPDLVVVYVAPSQGDAELVLSVLRGEGINVLTGADAGAPYGGAAFHDNKVWVRGL